MDKKINRLIDGSSDLSRHFGSENWEYWEFPEVYIDANKDLKQFLTLNKDVEVISILKKISDKTFEPKSSIGFYQKPFLKISNNQYFVHDSVRNILYNYCVFLLTEDLKMYIRNVKNTVGVYEIEKDIYSYPYSEEYSFRELFYKNLNNPKALNNLITRSFNARQFLGERQFINLKFIENLVRGSHENFNYSKLKM